MRTLSHDQVLLELRGMAGRADARAIAAGFVASLGEPPGFWRAPLVALAAAGAVPEHAIGETFAAGDCKECGLKSLVLLKEEIHERGQCLPGDLASALVVLRAVLSTDPPAPTPADVERVRRIFELIGTLPDGAREGQLNAALGRAKLVAGNKYDRRHVIETFGACGVLETPDYPGFTTKWTSFAGRQDRPNKHVECDPPIAWWTAANGVSSANVERWFGHLGLAAPGGVAPRATSVAEGVVARQTRAARAARVTELAIGDAVAFSLEPGWIAAIVVRHHRDRGGTVPIVELVDWSGAHCPDACALAGKRARGDRRGKDMIRNPILLAGLFTRADPRGRWRVVGAGFPPPSVAHLTQTRALFSVHHVDDMKEIARSAGLMSRAR